MSDESTPEQGDASDAALRQQLSELNRRSHIYSARLWQTPLAFFTVLGIVFGLGDGNLLLNREGTLAFMGLLGLLLAAHMLGMRDGTKRAVANIQRTEVALGLPETAQWKPALYIDLLILLVAGGGVLLLGSAFWGWIRTVADVNLSLRSTQVGAWYRVLPTFGELCGVMVGSYGILRESFADLAAKRPFGEGRYGEGPYGGGSSRFVLALVRVGLWTRLLPLDRQITLTDRKRNASFAVTGVIVLVVSMLADLILQVASSP